MTRRLTHLALPHRLARPLLIWDSLELLELMLSLSTALETFSALGLTFPINLTHDLIIVVLLPPLLFHTTIDINLTELRADLTLVLAMTLVGLPVAVLLLGWLGKEAFGFPLIVSLLFAAIILPTDPAAVVSLFEEFDAPDCLSITMEGESRAKSRIQVG